VAHLLFAPARNARTSTRWRPRHRRISKLEVTPRRIRSWSPFAARPYKAGRHSKRRCSCHQGQNARDEDKIGWVSPPGNRIDLEHEQRLQSARPSWPAWGDSLNVRCAAEEISKIESSRKSRAFLIARRFTRKGEDRGNTRNKLAAMAIRDCWIRFEPLPESSGFDLSGNRRGVIPTNYKSPSKRPHRIHGKGCPGGQSTSYPASCYDGSLSRGGFLDMAFKVPPRWPSRTSFPNADRSFWSRSTKSRSRFPRIHGRRDGDLNSRATHPGDEHSGRKQVIESLVPLSELYTYSANSIPSRRAAACSRWNTTTMNVSRRGPGKRSSRKPKAQGRGIGLKSGGRSSRQVPLISE